MQCQPDETKIRSFYHHPFPYLIRGLKIALVSLPFVFLALILSGSLDSGTMMMIYAGIMVLFALVIAYDALLYFLDRVVVTNKRIVYVNWKDLFNREENEANLDDIQDITTSEFGILSRLPIFDYGTFQVETAASKVAIVFEKATDPEGIKNFIYTLQRKSSSILREAVAISKNAAQNSQSYDRTPTQNFEKTEATGGTGIGGVAGKPTGGPGK